MENCGKFDQKKFVKFSKKFRFKIEIFQKVHKNRNFRKFDQNRNFSKILTKIEIVPKFDHYRKFSKFSKKIDTFRTF